MPNTIGFKLGTLIAAPLVVLLMLPATSDASRSRFLQPALKVFGIGYSASIKPNLLRYPRDYMTRSYEEMSHDKELHRRNGEFVLRDSQLESCVRDATSGAAGTVGTAVLFISYFPNDDIDLFKLLYSQSTLRPILKMACGADVLLGLPLVNKLPQTPYGHQERVFHQRKFSVQDLLAKVSQTKPSQFSHSLSGDHPEIQPPNQSYQNTISNYSPTTVTTTGQVPDTANTNTFDVSHHWVHQCKRSLDASEQTCLVDVDKLDVTGLRRSNDLFGWQPTRQPTMLVPRPAALPPRRSPLGKQRSERQSQLS